MEHHRDGDATVTFGVASWVRQALKDNAPVLAMTAFALLLLRFVLTDLSAQVKAMHEDVQAHIATTAKAIDRRESFEVGATRNLEALVGLQRQTCVNTAKSQSQIDDCLKVK